MTNGPEHGRADCTPLVRDQCAGGSPVVSFESQELPYSKLVLSHGIKTTDFPFDFRELLSYQRKASIKCVPPLPLHFEELLSQQTAFLLSDFGRAENLLSFLAVP